jgi:peptidoglycan LD-endopeptidase LytH
MPGIRQQIAVAKRSDSFGFPSSFRCCARALGRFPLVGIIGAAVLLATGCAPGGWFGSSSDVEADLEAPVASADLLGEPSMRSQVSTAGVSRVVSTDADQDTLLVATARELKELSAALGIPVQGVVRADLRDSYTESRGDRSHEAIDILVARGTPVLSAADGRVLRLFDSKPGGLMVYATDASERFILLYGHLDGYAPGIVDGMTIRRGQVIGYVGTTGNASEDTPHLHFGILRGRPDVSWSKGVAANPFPLLVR